MELVVTLVAPGPLEPEVVAKVVEALGAERARRLGQSATDVFFEGAVAAGKSTVATTLGEAAIDYVVQPVDRRQTKRLLLSDMDSTLIEQECIDELAAVIGIKEKVAAITARAMRGEVAFEDALQERVALLKGVPVAAIDTLLAERITLSANAHTMTRSLAAAGVKPVLVSGGFTAFAGPIATKLEMAGAFSNTLAVSGAVLTGEVVPPVLGADAKRERLLAECDALGIGPEDAIAVGDGANDLAMIEAAGLGLAYRAKPAVVAAADAAIVHTDLSTVLYALGLGEEAIDWVP